ncbi:MAG: hypothetical protein ACRC2M_16760, partial [Planktothrix sp.]
TATPAAPIAAKATSKAPQVYTRSATTTPTEAAITADTCTKSATAAPRAVSCLKIIAYFWGIILKHDSYFPNN